MNANPGLPAGGDFYGRFSTGEVWMGPRGMHPLDPGALGVVQVSPLVLRVGKLRPG